METIGVAMLRMIEGHEGLFYMEMEGMPGPQDYLISPYVLPGAFGRQEKEEAAARLISVCQEFGAWCGVSFRYLKAQMFREIKVYLSHIEDQKNVRQYNEDEHHRWMRERRLCILTLGAFALFKRPTRPEVKSIPEMPVELPFSSIFHFGVDPVYIGLQDLVRMDLIKLETCKERETDVLFPTPELLSSISGHLL